ncbi:hypothetical protein R6Q59_035932 [Mikania micrantha]
MSAPTATIVERLPFALGLLSGETHLYPWQRWLLGVSTSFIMPDIFKPDGETLIGLVQDEGESCGELATIQEFVLKYLMFCHKSWLKMYQSHQWYQFQKYCKNSISWNKHH